MTANAAGEVGFAFIDPNTNQLTYLIGAAQQPVAARQTMDNKALEAEQVASFASALAAHGVDPGQFRPVTADPPDQIWTLGGKEWNLELTQLAMEKIRVVQGQLHSVTYRLTQLLTNQPGRFKHLTGLRARLEDIAAGNLPPAKAEILATDIADALEQHTAGPGAVDPVGGPPVGSEGLPIWGFDGVRVVLEPAEDASMPFTMTSALQQSITVVDVQDALDRCCLGKKDDPRNEILLISTEAPNDKGLAWAQERWLYRIALERGLAPSTEPAHLQSIYLHRHSTTDVSLLWSRNGTSPPVPSEVLEGHRQGRAAVAAGAQRGTGLRRVAWLLANRLRRRLRG